jgi:hypothetical protein
MSNIEYIAWDKADWFWGRSPRTNPSESSYIWNLVYQATTGKKSLKDLSKEDKKKVIRLIMKWKDIKVYDERKEIKNIELHIDNIKLIAEELKKNVQIIY